MSTVILPFSFAMRNNRKLLQRMKYIDENSNTVGICWSNIESLEVLWCYELKKEVTVKRSTGSSIVVGFLGSEGALGPEKGDYVTRGLRLNKRIETALYSLGSPFLACFYRPAYLLTTTLCSIWVL